MGVFRRKRLWITAVAAICALAAFLYCHAQPPRWEARSTVAVYAEDAIAVLPGLLRADIFTTGTVSAYHIPGTCLVEIACRGTSQEAASSGLNAAIGQIPTLLQYLGNPGTVDTALQSAVSVIGEPPDTLRVCLTAAITGAAVVALLLFPPFPRQEELDLTVLLISLGKLTKRFWLLILAVCLLGSCGNYLREKSASPVYESTALVSVGTYDPKTAGAIADTVCGLIGSDLMDGNISAAAIGGSNLFTLTATAASPAAAQEILRSAIGDFPHIAAYAQADLPMAVRQAPSLPDSPENPFHGPHALAKGLLLSLALCAAMGIAAVLRTQNIDSAFPGGYNDSQSEGGNPHEKIH